MKTGGFLVVLAAVVSLTVDRANSLDCYRCDSQVETSDHACTLGLTSLENQTCAEDEQCYSAMYDLVKLDRQTKLPITVRSCGRKLGGCATEHLRMVNKYGQQYSITQNTCMACDTDLCNGPQQSQSDSDGRSDSVKSAADRLTFLPVTLVPVFILANKLF